MKSDAATGWLAIIVILVGIAFWQRSCDERNHEQALELERIKCDSK